ncbi:hypothetical protein [Spirosoma rhododendri]|uniref:hypothetical protein n=1 Tax=Spirosoma rhododendri TaxID=2728024 RepID=UPI0020C4F0C5|nr:hypothetical protein [Spirosoma rhododendri]
MQRLRMLGCLLAMLVGSSPGLYAQVPVVEKAHPFVNYTELGALFGRVIYPSFIGSQSNVVQNKVNLTIQTFNGVRLLPRLAVGASSGSTGTTGHCCCRSGRGFATTSPPRNSTGKTSASLPPPMSAMA